MTNAECKLRHSLPTLNGLAERFLTVTVELLLRCFNLEDEAPAGLSYLYMKKIRTWFMSHTSYICVQYLGHNILVLKQVVSPSRWWKKKLNDDFTHLLCKCPGFSRAVFQISINWIPIKKYQFWTSSEKNDFTLLVNWQNDKFPFKAAEMWRNKVKNHEIQNSTGQKYVNVC